MNKLNSPFLIYPLAVFAVIAISLLSCKKEDPPTLTTLPVTEVIGNTAQSGGNITDDGGASVTSRGVVWSTSENPTMNNKEGSTSDGIGDGQFVSNLTGLSPGTSYYVRAYAINSAGTAYGNREQFTTVDLASVTTAEVTDITSRTATSGGNVTDDGGAEVTARGVVWGTSEHPTVETNVGKTTDGSGTGSFVSELTELNPGTTYYVRAYATNIEGTSYGEQMEFSTDAELATVTTAEVTDITATSAKSGGNVTNDGGAKVTARGVVWSTNENPTIENNEGYTEDGEGTGEFVSEITGLSPHTIYNLKAYAINNVGIVYGDEFSFTSSTIFIEGDGVTDADGNLYRTIIIGNQEWMAENLQTTKFNNETEILLITDGDLWINSSTAAYCWYENNEELYKTTYGGLYNWHAVNTGTLCPIGWHVPTDNEWQQLVDYLGGNNIAGGKMKEVGTEYWDYPNWKATNESGFTAMPAGARSPSFMQDFIQMGFRAWWWSSTEYPPNYEWQQPTYAWYRGIYHGGEEVERSDIRMEIGMSIRCIRDAK